MGRGNHFWERMAENADLTTELYPGQPIVEIAGDTRVLVERHMGVKAYSRERIVIQTKMGVLCICGCGLELLKMTREQLVIRGKIDNVSIQRRG